MVKKKMTLKEAQNILDKVGYKKEYELCYPFCKRREDSEFEPVLVKDNKVIVKTNYMENYRAPYNGYVAIENSKIPKKWQGNYNADGLQYLQIHGGITFCEKHDNYTVFGFDCAHADDKENKRLYELDYVMELTEQMEQQILEYAKRYNEWEKAKKKRKLDILDEIRVTAKHKQEYGFGALIGILCGGKLG